MAIDGTCGDVQCIRDDLRRCIVDDEHFADLEFGIRERRIDQPQSFPRIPSFAPLGDPACTTRIPYLPKEVVGGMKLRDAEICSSEVFEARRQGLCDPQARRSEVQCLGTDTDGGEMVDGVDVVSFVEREKADMQVPFMDGMSVVFRSDE